MTLSTLPDLTVEIAFSPTNIINLSQSWTNVTRYVREFSTRGGRQHYLDRIESSSLSLTLDNRDGFFYNFYPIGPRLPIRITARWAGIDYEIFWGVISSADPVFDDALNSDLTVQAEDLLKFLSLRNLWNPGLYSSFVGSSVAHWYRCDPSSRNTLVDEKGGAPCGLRGAYGTASGVLLYDKSASLDLTAGTDNPSCIISIPNSSVQGIEFWILGSNNFDQDLLSILMNTPTVDQDVSLRINGRGHVTCANGSSGDLESQINVSDGFWHHIALIIDSSLNKLVLIVDDEQTQGGVAFPTYNLTTSSGDPFELGDNIAAYIDEIITSGSTVVSADVVSRYRAGILLRRDATGGDFIAQVLMVAGFPYTQNASQEFIPQNYTIDWDESGTAPAYVPETPSNGSWMWGIDSSVVGSTALEVIQSITDAEIGSFYQSGDGTLIFHTKNFPYRTAGNSIPSGTAIWGDDASAGAWYQGPSLSILADDVDVWTTVIVSPSNGDEQTYQAPSSVSNRYGWATLQKSNTMASSVQEIAREAEFLGKLYASPLTRVQSVTFLSTTHKMSTYASLMPMMLGSNFEKRVQFYKTAPGTIYKVTDQNFLIESTNHSFSSDPGVWATTFTLDPYPIRTETQFILLLDSAAYGKLDNNYLA